MRSFVSLLIIAFALCALAGGYFSGTAAVPRISLHAPSPDPQTTMVPLDLHAIRGLQVPQSDEVALDDFASDPAVVSSASGGDIQNAAHLSVIVVTCGHSAPLEMPFLSLDIPIAIVVDPDGPAARMMADAAASSAKTTFVQAGLPLTPSALQTLHGDFPRAAGVAARLQDVPSRDVLRTLRELQLSVFDEFGDVRRVRDAFRAAGVRYVARTITVDDHLQAGYVQYMLDQAVHLGRGTTARIMMRPLPDSLRALQSVMAQAQSDGVTFEPAVR